ncbi:hypothetical protein QB788_003464 [Salmonella enterica]|nr:hypothetical protein [Salmonella enterica]
MQEVNVHISGLESTSPFIMRVEIDGKHVGFICENRDHNKNEKPVSVVSLDGTNLGDFCCVKHAGKFLAMKEYGDDSLYLDADDPRAAFGILGLLAMLESMKGKRLH